VHPALNQPMINRTNRPLFCHLTFAVCMFPILLLSLMFADRITSHRHLKYRCKASVMILNPTPNFPFIFHYFPPFYSALSVTCSSLIPSRAARTAIKSPDKSPDGSPDHSAVNYHMPSLRSPQHSAASPFILLRIASL